MIFRGLPGLYTLNVLVFYLCYLVFYALLLKSQLWLYTYTLSMYRYNKVYQC